MLQLRTTVLMKTDIVGSTPQFRTLLTSDLQALLIEHRAMVARLAAEEGGEIFKSTGDGYWLKFPSATGAAKSAIAMHEALRLAQSFKGDDRLSMRVVVGLGDAATQNGDLAGDVLALIARIEEITPPDEIYLTATACLALTQSEVRTEIVGSFSLKGFAELIPVYRDVGSVERTLDTLDELARATTTEFSGTVVVCDRRLLLHDLPRCRQSNVCSERACARLEGGESKTTLRLRD
jgi:class 3 adenylate cyclase